jgi:hypothetical protein
MNRSERANPYRLIPGCARLRVRCSSTRRRAYKWPASNHNQIQDPSRDLQVLRLGLRLPARMVGIGGHLDHAIRERSRGIRGRDN